MPATVTSVGGCGWQPVGGAEAFVTSVATTQRAAAAKPVRGATTEMQAVRRMQQIPANVRADNADLQ